MGEIIGCSERENDYDKLLSAIRAKGMNEEDYKSYLELRKFGSAPHSGFGLGLERFLMYITGVSNIRDVQLYPRPPKKSEFNAILKNNTYYGTPEVSVLRFLKSSPCISH